MRGRGRVSNEQRMKWSVPAVGRAFAVLVVLEVLALVFVAVDGMAQLGDSVDQHLTKNVRYTAYLSVYVSLSFLYFGLDAILLENVFQFWCALVVHAFCCLFLWWHVMKQNLSDFLNQMALPFACAATAFQVLYFVLGVYIQRFFGWRIYKRIGARVDLQRLYKTFSIFHSLLKLDLFTAVLLVMMGSFYLWEVSTVMFLNIAAAVLTLAWSIFGYHAVRHESRRRMFAFWAFALVEPTYVAYKLDDIYLHPSHYPADVSLTQFFIVGSAALVIRSILLLWSVWAYDNFGRGLVERVFTKEDAESRGGLTDELIVYAQPLCPWSFCEPRDDDQVVPRAQAVGNGRDEYSVNSPRRDPQEPQYPY